MRKFRDYVLMLLGASAIGVALPSGAGAQSALQDEQLACEEALRQNTVAALENFLKEYRYGDSTCRALALNALGGLEGDQQNRDPRRNNNGYNQ